MIYYLVKLDLLNLREFCNNVSLKIFTNYKNHPAEAKIKSHQLMLQTDDQTILGGIYSWLPLGYKVMKKIEQIVRRQNV